MSDYERLRQRHLARAMALAPQLIEQLDWRSERLSEHRLARLRELVAVAKQRSPWHRERLAAVDPARLDLATLRELPPMTKTELMAHFDRIVTDERLSLKLVNGYLETITTGSYLLDRYTAITSGGSSGERAVFVYDWDGWATFWVMLFRYLLRAKLRDPELASRPVVMAWVMAAHSATPPPRWAARSPGRTSPTTASRSPFKPRRSWPGSIKPSRTSWSLTLPPCTS
jgi:phenylacetate-CoA ligase